MEDEQWEDTERILSLNRIHYCEKCKKMMEHIKGNFVLGNKSYRKLICRPCDIIYKDYWEVE